MEIFIRQISTEDALAITDLSRQLGYTLSVEQTLENIKAVLENKDCNGFVAVYADKLVGWIGLNHAVQIETPPFCEIRGLVVDKEYRNRGIGKILIEKAKHWTSERGNSKLRLRCNTRRTEAHLFYQHLGFREIKQQKVFEIEI